MLKTLITTILLLLIFNIEGFSQSYLGKTIKQVNFREGPGTEYNLIKSLKPGSQIFIISLEIINDFYNIIDIATDQEGYIHKSYVKMGQEIEKSEQGMFTPNGQSKNYNPEVEVYNNTKVRLTLKLNDIVYSFDPQQKQTISIAPGSCNYRASAPNVIPNIGVENMQSNHAYTWQFYISSR